MESENKKVVCVATATRAEYGLLKPLIKKLLLDDFFEIKVVVTGMHLSPEFGFTIREIEQDGIKVDKKIEILLSADTPSAVSKSMGIAMIGFAEYFAETLFDALILLGDRYELLAIACAAMNEQIPIIHLHGGETTEGAIDEAIRHSITKMSYLHMTSTETYRHRVIQLGESPERVFCVGSLGVENIVHTNLLKKDELEKDLQFQLGEFSVLVTFHPVTLEKNSTKTQIKELLNALSYFPEWKFVITKANADKEGRIINQEIEDYSMNHDNVKVYDSLGVTRYLSVMKYSKMVIGNSSSGILETPSFHIPTVNIGDRQRGRIRPESVIDCRPEKDCIIAAMKRAEEMVRQNSLRDMVNPYGDGNASTKIIEAMKKSLYNKDVNLKKKFYDLI